jgi:NAD(P)-dependent dehydrogenase (short-subunit alcohol dehydrogenase family)
MQIQGHTFLVTGGSSGLGAACVRTLASAGGNVVIADVNRPAGERLAAELGKACRIVRERRAVAQLNLDCRSCSPG